MTKHKKVIGSVDKVDLPDFGVEHVNAKIDTGAYRSSLHCKKIKLQGDTLSFSVLTDNGYKEFQTKDWKKKEVRSSNGKSENRFVIKTRLRLFEKSYIVSFSLTDRSKMKYPLLLGKKFLKDRFVVDVAQKNISANQRAT